MSSIKSKFLILLLVMLIFNCWLPNCFGLSLPEYMKVYSNDKIIIYTNTALLQNAAFPDFKANNQFNVDLIYKFATQKELSGLIKLVKENINKNPDLYVYMNLDDADNISYMIDNVTFDCDNNQAMITKETFADDNDNALIWHSLNETHKLLEEEPSSLLAVYKNITRFFNSIINNQ